MNNYYAKSKIQYKRECMRENRSRCRADEIFRIVQDDENEDVITYTANTTDQVSADIINDPPITMVDRSTSSLGSGSSDESKLDSDDADDEDENVEVEIDDDDTDEFVNEHDVNNLTKLFTSSPLSGRDACFIIIKLARRLNLNKNGIKHFLNGIRCLFQSDVKLPRIVKGLMKIIGMYQMLFNVFARMMHRSHFTILRNKALIMIPFRLFILRF